MELIAKRSAKVRTQFPSGTKNERNIQGQQAFSVPKILNLKITTEGSTYEAQAESMRPKGSTYEAQAEPIRPKGSTYEAQAESMRPKGVSRDRREYHATAGSIEQKKSPTFVRL